jgi:hypothetical protein
MIIAGLDLSLTSAGIAVLTDGKPTLLTSVGHGGHNADSYLTRSRRIVSQSRAVIDTLDRAPTLSDPRRPSGTHWRYDLAVIEGPSYGSNMPSNHDRAGLWWGVYSALAAKRVPVAVVAPLTRAKWATGKGNAQKPAVLAAVRQSWLSLRIANDDQADALTLAAMGTVWLGGELHWPIEKWRHTGLAAVAWPEIAA